MSVLRNPSCDRVAALLFKADGPLAFSGIVALSELPEATVTAALRRLSADGVVIRTNLAGGRPAWDIDEAHPLASVNRSLLGKAAAGADLAALLRPIVNRFPLITKAVLIDERPEATLVCVLSDPTTLDWFKVDNLIRDAAEDAGRTVATEGVSEQWFRAARTSKLVQRIRSSNNAIVIKGGR